MSQKDDQLSEVLKHLTASVPQDAPAHLGANLRAAFCQRHAARKPWWIVRVAALAACLVVALVLIQHEFAEPGVVLAPAKQHSVLSATVTQHQFVKMRPEEAAQPGAPQGKHNDSKPSKGRFVSLPGYDPKLPTGNLVIVRLGLTGAALGELGMPMNGIDPERKMIADVLMDEDGTPYAMRLADPFKNQGGKQAGKQINKETGR